MQHLLFVCLIASFCCFASASPKKRKFSPHKSSSERGSEPASPKKASASRITLSFNQFPDSYKKFKQAETDFAPGSAAPVSVKDLVDNAQASNIWDLVAALKTVRAQPPADAAINQGRIVESLRKLAGVRVGMSAYTKGMLVDRFKEFCELHQKVLAAPGVDQAKRSLDNLVGKLAEVAAIFYQMDEEWKTKVKEIYSELINLTKDSAESRNPKPCNFDDSRWNLRNMNLVD